MAGNHDARPILRRPFLTGWAAMLLAACAFGRPPTAPPLADAGPFPMYDPLPQTGVRFNVSDALLAALLHHGEALEAANSHVFFAPEPPLAEPFRVIVEGAEYFGAWLETQPMAGAMYASRDVRLALNNQLVFMRSQRVADGRYPPFIQCGHVHGSRTCSPTQDLQPNLAVPFQQGLYMASPAVDVAWFMNLTQAATTPPPARGGDGRAGTSAGATAYLRELYASLQAYDAYLWATHNDSACAGLRQGEYSPHACPPTPSAGSQRGLLWSAGAADSGEDGTDKFANASGPFQSMDMMGYSHDCRRSLARIATALGEPPAVVAGWEAAAAHVRNATIAGLWRPEAAAMFYRDASDDWVPTLCHNNLRMMWHGVFTQGMADAFVRRHLMNQSEFWTRMPLPSIAVSDSRFRDTSGNNWSGPPEGLTIQRAIRALESYGHLAELTLLGRALTASLLLGCGGRSATPANNTCHYPQQIDPFSAVPQTNSPDDGYGPMILATLELTALRAGIVPRPGLNGLLWSGLVDGGVATEYEQRLGGSAYRLEANGSAFAAWRDGAPLFRCTAGVRVVTDLRGRPLEVWGIDDATHDVVLDIPQDAGPARQVALAVAPNQKWGLPGVHGGAPALLQAVPFVAPHSPPRHM